MLAAAYAAHALGELQGVEEFELCRPKTACARFVPWRGGDAGWQAPQVVDG